MNIIKLKDHIKPYDEYYNTHLKGKYAYWIHMRYIVSFDDMDYHGYVAVEEDISKLLKNTNESYPKPYGCPYYDIYNDFEACNINDYIDMKLTDESNLIRDYILYNKYTSSSELTIDEIKQFRTWLAKTLLTFDADNLGDPIYDLYTEETTHMLQYYANNMYDDLIKYLNIFGKQKTLSTISTGCSCCHTSSDLSSLYNSNISICDGVSIYKQGIYNLMVMDFSNIDFWKNKPQGFLKEFKLYIDNIIKLNLPIGIEVLSDFVDCGCQLGATNNKYNIFLQNLSTSLQYFIDEDINQHKLFILDSFSNWSKYLYESMQW